jgi:hypothetical protein
MKPHVCPKCDGEGEVMDTGIDGSAAKIATRPCPPCNGKGVVWELKAWPNYVPPPMQHWTDKWRFIDGEWSPVPLADVGLSDRTEEDS